MPKFAIMNGDGTYVFSLGLLSRHLAQRRPTAGDDGVRPSGGSFWTHREGSRHHERGIAARFPRGKDPA